MKRLSGFIYALVCYAIGFSALLYWIASLGNLLEFASIDGAPRSGLGYALSVNIGLVVLFGLQHSIMARKSFKSWLTQYIPAYVERSTFILCSGLVLALMTWQWQPIGGVIWNIDAGSPLYIFLYGMYFIGWGILFISTFLINHFDLFGLRQAYFHLTNRKYVAVKFKVVSFYKYVRHPLYFGLVVGMWSTPTMTVTHLLLAVLISGYLLIGISYEERDLKADFGDNYEAYKSKTPKLIPIPKAKSKRVGILRESR